jgi:uncharacterized protein (TIGR02453 family)
MGKTKIERFAGFPKGTLTFLRGMRAHNDRSWFEAHRAQYDEFYVEAGKSFVKAIGASLSRLAPDIVADARINGSILRVNRDVRFSKDKTPYKDHLDFAFAEGERNASMSTLWVRVSPDGFQVGAGLHRSDSSQLAAFRAAVADAKHGKTLAALAKKLRSKGLDFGEPHYKRYPSGYSEDGPAAEFLLHNTLFVSQNFKASAACAPGVVTECVREWKTLMPLHRWLMDCVQV